MVGRLQKHEPDVILEKLWIMGKLLQFTRQTDMLMVDEKSVRAMADCFLSGRYVLDVSCPITESAGAQKPAPAAPNGVPDPGENSPH